MTKHISQINDEQKLVHALHLKCHCVSVAVWRSGPQKKHWVSFTDKLQVRKKKEVKSIHWKQIPASKDFRINFPLSLYLLRQYIESERELNVLEEAGYLLCSLHWLDIRETEISWAKRTQKTQWNDWGEMWRGPKRGCTICYCVLPTEKATLKRQRVPPAVIVTDLHNCWWASCTHSERDQGSVSRYGASLKQNHCIINDGFFFTLFSVWFKPSYQSVVSNEWSV